MKKTKKLKFILTFCTAVALLTIARHTFDIYIPQPKEKTELLTIRKESTGRTAAEKKGTAGTDTTEKQDVQALQDEDPLMTALNALGVSDTDSAHLYLPEIYKPITYLNSYSACFPDINPVQLRAAITMGIEPVATREEALKYVETRQLVNISNSPYYAIDPLTHSIPYLTPECQELLNTICINFIDSLTAKGLQPHLPIITSVLRTSKDIKKLQSGNVNSTTNSCHCYGTTVDITYNRFYPITGNNKESRRNVVRYNAQMKKILAEVLLDLRMQGRCYVKHEIKQACFHLTIRPTNKN